MYKLVYLLDNNCNVIFNTEEELKLYCKDKGWKLDNIKPTLDDYPNPNRRRKQYRGYKLVRINNQGENKIIDNMEKVTKKEIDFVNGKITADKILNIREEEITEERLLKEFNLNQKEWKLEKFTSSVWNNGSKNKEDELNNLYAIKCWFKQREKLDYDIKELKKLIDKEFDREFEIKTDIQNVEKFDSDTLLLNIADLHLNKAGIDYNTEIAKTEFIKALQSIVEHSTAKNCIFIIGEDFFNIDTLSKTTTRGTPQETEYNIYDMFEIGINLMSQTLNYLKEHFYNLKCILIQGNHDNLLSYMLARGLALRFADIDIDYSVLKRKYIMIGSSLIGLGHLDTELKSTKTYLMQNEVKEYFGKSKFNYFVSGHFHNYSVEEIGGITYIRLPSLSGKDEWHNNMGFVTATRGAIGLEFSAEKGLVNKILYNIQGE